MQSLNLFTRTGLLRVLTGGLTAFTLAGAALLTGCGGGDTVSQVAAIPTPTAAGSIIGSVVKGPVNAATVCVFLLDNTAAGKKGAQVAVTGATAANGCVVTAADGSYSLSLPTITTGDLIVEASGGTYCSNEALYDASARTCGGTGGAPVALSAAKLSTVITAPASGAVASAVVTPLSTSAFYNMVTAGQASVVAFRSQFTALVTTSGLPTSLSADTLANDPTLQGVLSNFQKIAGIDPAMLNTFLTRLATGGYRYGTGGFTLVPVVTTPPTTSTPPTGGVTTGSGGIHLVVTNAANTKANTANFDSDATALLVDQGVAQALGISGTVVSGGIARIISLNVTGKPFFVTAGQSIRFESRPIEGFMSYADSSVRGATWLAFSGAVVIDSVEGKRIKLHLENVVMQSRTTSGLTDSFTLNGTMDVTAN